jgi:ribosomal protein L7/L12
MIEVRISGWRRGAMKVSANEAIRNQTSLGLKQAKSVIDQCMDGKETIIQFESLDPALQLAKDLDEMGFNTSVFKSDTGQLIWQNET